MAHSDQSESSIIVWRSMCNKWIRHLKQNNREIDYVCNFFDNFIDERPNYQFTVAQIFSGLYDVGITCQQYAEIKDHLEKICQLVLPDILTSEFLKEGSIQIRSFHNSTEFQRFQDHELAIKNRPVVHQMCEKVNQHTDRIKNVFSQPGDKVIISFDIKASDLGSERIFEIGHTVVLFSSVGNRKNDRPIVKVTSKRHFIVTENPLHFEKRNDQNRFRFGSSETVSLAEALEKFRMELEKCDFLVGHSLENSDECLKKHDVNLTKLKKELIDTQLVQMAKGMEPSDVYYSTSNLKFLLDKYDVKYEEDDLHNAGCCAFYIMLVFLRQMGSTADTVDRLLNPIS